MSTFESQSRPHDIRLVDALSELKTAPYSGTLFRVTRQNADPTAFSTSGGRWAPPSNIQAVPVLNTSLTRDGAIAEVVAYLSELSPPPNMPVKVHRLNVTARAVVRLTTVELERLGVHMDTFHGRLYARQGQEPATRTQEIGAVANFLEYDGLMVPSARWSSENLILFQDNHGLSEKLDAEQSEDIDWHDWLRSHQREMIQGGAPR